MLLHLASNQQVPHRWAGCRYGAGLPRATQRLHFCLFCVLSRLCCCEHVAWFWKQRKGRVRRLSCPPAGAVPVPSHSAWVSGAGPLGWGCLQAALTAVASRALRQPERSKVAQGSLCKGGGLRELVGEGRQSCQGAAVGGVS